MFVVKNVTWAIPNGSCLKDTNSGIWVFTILGEGYVIRWAYFVLTDRIAKDRKSRCRSTVAGRVRCAYFFWQGNDCSVNEKGAAAIMAVELDEEKGPQVRCPAPPPPQPRKKLFMLMSCLWEQCSGADLGGGCRGCALPPLRWPVAF